MIDKYRDKLDEKGVSPVIGVILLVAVTVALVALATVIVFDIGSGVSDTSDASVQMEQTDSGVQATIVRNENVDEFILRHEDGTEQRSTKSIGSFTYDNGDGEYTLIAVVGGNEEVIRSTTVVGAESGEKLSGTADASVQMEQTDSGVKANIVRNENVEEFILKHEDGTEQRSTKSIGSFTYDNGYGEYTLIAVVGGNEEVIRSTTVVGAESGETLSGTAEINSLIVGAATVEAYDAGGTLVNSTTTDANGQYELTVADASSARIVLNTEGDITYNGEPLHASAEQSGFSAGDTVNFNFDENTVISGVSVNGESITVVSALEGESSSFTEVGNLAQLQAMQEDLSADYKLIRNIDASETETWNEITSDEFKQSIPNGYGTELNYVASESTINVVNKSGVDVTFTTNAGNDAITIDDPYYDLYSEEFTISYDLETPINQGFNPVGTYDYVEQTIEFTGSFDGQNHTISNLSINRLDYVGLFGAIGAGGEVKNVGVINVNITGEKKVGGLVGRNYGTVSNSYSTGNVTGESYDVGGLVGFNYNDGTVSNSHSTGNVTGAGDVGGLVGYNEGGNISNSYSTGNVTGEDEVGGVVGFNEGTVSNSYSTGNVTGESVDVGGLIGYNYDGTVSNSYSTGNVTGEEYVGGLIGYNDDSTVSNSYSTGNVTGEKEVGGLVGDNYVGENINGNISNSYWDTESTGQSSSAVLPDSNGLTTSQMQGSSASSNMIGFDFKDTWSTVTGDYPELQG
jgi:flagellin-like protein